MLGEEMSWAAQGRGSVITLRSCPRTDRIAQAVRIACGNGGHLRRNA